MQKRGSYEDRSSKWPVQTQKKYIVGWGGGLGANTHSKPIQIYRTQCTNTTTTYNCLKIDQANDLQTEKKELARRWLFRWTAGSPAVLQWWIEYKPFDAHCIWLNISIVYGWRSSLYLGGISSSYLVDALRCTLWRSSLHLVFECPLYPFQ